MVRGLFANMFKYRWVVLGLYVALLIPAAIFAARVQTDNSLDRMVVPGDEGREVFEEFRRVFGSDEFILFALEGKDIYSERFLTSVDEIERQMQKVPYLAHSRSMISLYREIQPLFNPHEPSWREKFRNFTLSTPFFNYQGLVLPDRSFTIILQLKTKTPAQRTEVVETCNAILDPFENSSDSPFIAVRKVGQPYINYEFDRSNFEIGLIFMPILLLFSMGFIWFLYRSFRGVLAVLIAMLVSIAFCIAMVELSGSVLTLVSGILPAMVMVVSIETVVHLYSGYVRKPVELSTREHLTDVLTHKWRACWYSVFTTSVGFGSFAFSPVTPVRDLGLFVAAGLVISYIVSFTLFPVLMDLLKPPTGQQDSKVGLQMFDPILAGIPTYTYWWRKSLVLSMTLVGAFALHSFFSMQFETNTLNYLDKENRLYQDTVWVENNLMGLLSMEVMLKGEKGQFSNPDSLRRLQAFEHTVNLSPDVQSLLSASTMLRMANFIENGQDDFPKSNFAISKYIMAVSQQDMWNNFVSPEFDALRISAITKSVDFHVFTRLNQMFNRVWSNFVEANPDFENVQLTLTGMAPLTSQITVYLLDTLLSSFGSTLIVVFFVFVVVIRRITYALISLLPSLFAILLMYTLMTFASIKLDIGSIMIAAVVLGISVDATIHFFQHFMEKLDAKADLEDSLQYSLIVTGRAIVVSTVVIVAGFISFGFSNFPPIKHFGLLTSAAVIFSLVGTMIYLPACLWLMSPKEKPKHLADRLPSGFAIFPPSPPSPPKDDRP